mgnify:CR=1 FL=1|tara:strand:+ start:849 stop:1649 length:801 start_codon:yes stop_codon:yes gene_type:complete
MNNYLNQFNLKGKKAIIVGGSGLIGNEIINVLAEKGAKVYVLDIKKPLIKKKNKRKINYIHFDCSSNLIEKSYKKILNTFKTPQIFINCSYPTNNHWGKSDFKNISFVNFKRNIDIHLNSYAWLAKVTAESMCKSKIKGSIIQFGSIYGLVGQDLSTYKGAKNMKENMAYSVIKGGVANLTRQMASYYGQYGIRINTICPGAVEGHAKATGKKQDKIFIKNYKNKVPLKRLAKPKEVAAVALFLSSDLSSYITGTSLVVDGGWTAI